MARILQVRKLWNLHTESGRESDNEQNVLNQLGFYVYSS